MEKTEKYVPTNADKAWLKDVEKAKHTPGPWKIIDDLPNKNVGYRAIVSEDDYTICEPSPMGQANANLIAAAPELLEALKRLIEKAKEDIQIDWQDREEAEAIIAKAEGVAQG